MILKNVIKLSLGVGICFASIIGSTNGALARTVSPDSTILDGGSGGPASSDSDSSSEARTGICPVGSLRYGDDAGITSVGQCNLPKEKDDDKLMKRVQTIINVIVGVIGVVTVAVIILGGISYVTSQGEAAKLTKAKNTILYGVVGLIVAMLAFAIVNFVLNSIF